MYKVIQTLDQSDTMCYMSRFVDLESKIQNVDGTITACVKVPGDSIWFDGHFPEIAVLPGVAQLFIVAEVLGEAIERQVRIRGVNRVRFKQAIMPGELIEVQIRPKENDTLNYGFRLFKCQELACSGFITLASEP
jgi:3-hydroxyacyl-[acyl-carrier-protein] dehydratase